MATPSPVSAVRSTNLAWVFIKNSGDCSSLEMPARRRKAGIGQSKTQPLPSSEFRLGMSLAELERTIKSNYPVWERLDTKRALNNRKDVPLPPDAKAEYLQSISMAKNTQNAILKHKFLLRSPLTSSGSVYSIVMSSKQRTRV
jgi:hypothetical protein